VRHPVRLKDGDYLLAWTFVGGAGGSGRPGAPAPRGEVPLHVAEDATVVLPLGR
jgi:hypothetical protein